MEPKDRTRTYVNDMGSTESWLVLAGGGPEGRGELGRRAPLSIFRRGRRPTSYWAGTGRMRETMVLRVGRPWRRSSAASKEAPRSRSRPAWPESRRCSNSFLQVRRWPCPMIVIKAWQDSRTRGNGEGDGTYV